MSSKTPELPLGMRKKIRAISDLVYQGKSIRGRRHTRIDGTLGSYENIHMAGEELECDQTFAKEAVMAAKAELLEGGYVEVIPQADGFPIYKSWIKNLSDPEPVYEKCELLKPLFLGDGCHLPEGAKIRIDVRAWDRRQYCYSDEARQAEHIISILAPSPKRVKLNAIEHSQKVDALFNKFFPAQTA